MIWIILLFYVLPLLASCVVGYYMTKNSGETVRDYLKGVLVCLIPLMNIIFLILMIGKTIHDNKTVQNFLNKKL